MSRTAIAYSVAPMLSVRNGASAVEFYKSAFGATEVFRIESPDGAVVARLAVEEAAQIRVQLCAKGLRAQAELAALARARRDDAALRAPLDRARERRLRLAFGARGRSLRPPLGDRTSA